MSLQGLGFILSVKEVLASFARALEVVCVQDTASAMLQIMVWREGSLMLGK